MVVYQYYTLKMRKRKGENLQNSSTMVFFPLYFIMDSGYTNEVSVYKLYLLGVNLSVIGRVLGQAFLRTTSPLRLRRATSPGRGGFGSPRKVNGFARGSPTRGAGAQRLRGCTKDSLTVSRSGENLSVIACAMPPPLSRGGLGIPQSFVSSPEAPLGRGAVRRSLTERFSPHHRSQPP